MSTKDASGAASLAESFAIASKEAYLAAKEVAEWTAYMANDQAKADAKAAKNKKVMWAAAESVAAFARNIAAAAKPFHIEVNEMYKIVQNRSKNQKP